MNRSLTRKLISVNFGSGPGRNLSRRSQSGVALLLVVFLVALASVLVLDLAYSTFLGGRLSASAERQLQAEYLLKSALNISRVLLREDKTIEDSPKDDWGIFKDGLAVPAEWLGLTQPNIQVQLEIRPEDTKFPLRQLVPSGSAPNTKWVSSLYRLFQQMDFDNDKEADPSGPFKGKHFESRELIGNLLDYMDYDKESYSDGTYSGLEGQLPDGTFPNLPIQRVGELSVIPGFTAERIRRLYPFITARTTNSINLNFAPKAVLKALHADLSDASIDEIASFRDSEDGPFTQAQWTSQIANFVSSDILDGPDGIRIMLSPASRQFQVISKIDYGTSTYFMQALIEKGSPRELPKIRAFELY
ncbi:MAG: hypothetical protein DCC75_00280 [Proteobacteria bacterium]|nr:MAG: hypothetical protein DCC75_00280 [Pseudomonadota bacterium]